MADTNAMKIMTIIVKSVRIFLEFVGTIVFGIRNWNYKPQKLPSIKNKLLVESASSLASKIRTRKVTSEEVTRLYIDRIKSINPLLNAVVDTRFEEAICEAQEADALLRDNMDNPDNEGFLKEKMPFFGVPMTIKECFQVKGMHQTAGLYSRKDIISTEDAPCVNSLKDAGAIVMAVTNVPELCMWWDTYNTIYGQTNNPYHFRRIVGGSSGGEAANLSGCGSPMSLGSDIGGSIRMPAYFNGVYGHKATTGIVDNSGQEPCVSGLDMYLSSGPICRYACDLRPMFKVIAGPRADVLQLDKKVDFRTLKIYYMEDDNGSPFTTPVETELKRAITKAVDYFKSKYDVQCEKLHLTQFRRVLDIYFNKMCGESDGFSFCSQMGDDKGQLNVWKELVKWTFGQSRHTYPSLIFGIMEKFAKWHSKTSMCTDALKDLDELNAFFEENLKDNEIFLFPPSPNEAPYQGQPIFRWYNPIYTAIFNILGVPVTACPMGLNSNGLPLGIQVVAGKYRDNLCLTVAEELEAAFGGWVCPSDIQD